MIDFDFTINIRRGHHYFRRLVDGTISSYVLLAPWSLDPYLQSFEHPRCESTISAWRQGNVIKLPFLAPKECS